MQNPEAAVDALLAVFPDTKKTKEALLKSSAYSFSSVCQAGKGDSIGVTDAKTWETIYGVMTTAMQFPTTNPISHYYTSDYLPATAMTCP